MEYTDCKEDLQTVLDRLNHFQSLTVGLKQGDDTYWAIHRTIDRLVRQLDVVYSFDAVLDPIKNIWS